MKCDGVTDDSAALQSSLNSALATVGNATVIMPPGTCIIDPGANITINSALWLQGAGRSGTTLKRKDSSFGTSILFLAADGVTLSDFGVDGNKGGQGVTTPVNSVATTAPSSGVTIQNMRFANSTGSDIFSPTIGAGLFIKDWLVADNDFENEGTAACGVLFTCGNVLLQQPLGLRLIGNQSVDSQNFALFSSVPGGGFVEVGNNTILNVNGFGVGLGGGPVGSAGAHVHHNFITTTVTDPFNLIDLAGWSDFTVDHNVLHHNGQYTTAAAPNGCIADFPPANHGVIDANECFSEPTTTISVTGIAVGGSDTTISNNHVQGCSGAGIAFTVGAAGPQRGVKIIGNTTKNNSNGTPGAHAGIDLFLAPGPGNLAAVSDVLIQNNHSYDDQATKTQGYGISIGLYGLPINFTNVIIEGNDVAGNMLSGIRNNATVQALVIRNNLGFNPVGVIFAPPFPDGTGTVVTNTTGFDVTLYITSGTNPINMAINGITLTGITVPGGGVVGPPIRLAANQSITLTYMPGGAPTWQWVAD
jgi:Right handed beta helix region